MDADPCIFHDDSDGERPLYPLDLENIEKFVQSGAMNFPNIARKEVEDRSRGDITSKDGMVHNPVHGTWSRVPGNYGAAMAFAFLNPVAYIFWWNKPLNVTCPIRVMLKESPCLNLVR
jgi:hypothetical protein